MKQYKERICPVCAKLKSIPAETICFDCQKDIESMRKIKIEYEKITDRFSGVFELPTYGLNIFHIPQNIYGYYAPNDKLDKLDEIFTELIKTILPEAIDQSLTYTNLANGTYSTEEFNKETVRHKDGEK